jgi:hypothetical protein
VIATCEGIIADARKQIDKLFADLPDSLKEWAAGEQAKFTDQLNNLHNQATETRNNFNKDLVNRAGTAVQEAREQIHALREKAKGMIGRLADAVNAFLENPGKAILEGLLQLVGIPPASFWALIAKIEKVIDDIANDPMNFANNLMKAIGQGFQQFFDNIGTHLLQGLLEWLLSGLKSVGVTLPKDFSLKSIITFFLQLMGITWARVRKLLVKHIGEKNVALIEKAFSVVADLIALGPQGIFDLLKDKLDPNTIMKQVLDAAIGFLIDALIKQVTARIILLFNPVGAIAQAVEAIYRVLKWIFTNAAKIFSLIETVVDGIANVIAGNIGGMASAVEKALAKLIAPVIDFLADYIGLGDLPEKIADVIKGFQDWVEGILDTVIGWLVEQGKKLLGALVGDKKKPDERTEEQKKADLDTAIGEANQLINNKDLSKKDIEKKLPKIKSQYNMTSLALVIDDSTETTETYHIHGAINPEADTTKQTDVVRMEEVKITFKRRLKHDETEYRRQLDGQQAGLNRLLVADWHGNRQAYLARAAESASGSGRSEKGDREQKQFRALERERLILEKIKAGMKPTQAAMEVDEFMATQAALHDPDQIAGGDPEEIVSLGARNINSSIGSQWKNNVGKLDEKVDPLIPKLSESQKKEIHMNVVLDLQVRSD